MNFEELSDEEIVKIAREKDKDLYAEIIKRYKAKLSHYLQKFTRNRDELDDILQVVFLKAYKNLYGFNIDKRFSPWIYRIAHNEALNQIKKNKNQINLDSVEYKILDEEAHIFLKLDKDFVKKSVNNALSKLSNKYRDPIILFYLEGNSYEEISDILRINKNTVGVLIMRGKEKLKEYLNGKI